MVSDTRLFNRPSWKHNPKSIRIRPQRNLYALACRHTSVRYILRSTLNFHGTPSTGRGLTGLSSDQYPIHHF